MRLPDVAERWRQAGVSVVPIVAKNQPAVRWKEFQARCPTVEEIGEWWGNGHPYGIAIICGAVSGGLEMTELEARALNSYALTDIANGADSLGIGDVWDQVSTGYTQASPSGGLHLVYRISDHEVPGNEKIARNEDNLVLAETRGEGGYFVGAPSPGSCHPSGEGWLLASGDYGSIPTITWEQRCLIHEAIRLALDFDEPKPPATQPPRSTPGSTLATVAPAAFASPGMRSGATSLSPGDDWSSRTDWAEILEHEGWTFFGHGVGRERLWVRPGKDRRDGHSASTDYNDKPGFYVWSTSAGLPTEEPLTKLFIYAHYSFNGDMSTCAQYLKRQGYGSAAVPDLTMGELAESATTDAGERTFSLDDSGNAMRLWNAVGRERFRFVHEEKRIHHWTGVQWKPDYTGALEREWIACTDRMITEAQTSDNAALLKHARACRNLPRINAAVHSMRLMEGATISASDMDISPDRLNLANGMYNVKTRELEPHDSKYLMTRTVNAKHDPQATCPRFESFMEQVLPDPEVRKYVQRAVGYSLLGKADRRAFFLIYGPSGTGKSQFLSTMEYVFGSYGATAAEGTFRTRESGGPTNDLHGLRGKRFVSTSETAENATFNENLLKRLTGRDQVVSREMYQSNVTWIPECTLWLATNHPPRFNSDDDAIWKRAKPVPFLTRFGTDVPEIPDYARVYLYEEADGILNWILAGLHDFLENGLGEPDAILAAASEHRSQSDSVTRFLDDQIADAVLIESSDGIIRTRELFNLYEEWCRSSGERGLGARRFMNRLDSTGRAKYTRTKTHSVWKGLNRPDWGIPGLTDGMT